MNWIDVIIILAFAFYFWRGLSQGIINILIELLGLVVSFLVAIKYYPVGAHFVKNYLNVPSSLYNPLGLLGVWLVVEVIYYLIVPTIVKMLPTKIKDSKFNRFAGGIGAMLKAFFIIGFVLLIVTVLPTSPKLKQDLSNSKIAQVMISKLNDFQKALGSNLDYEKYLSNTSLPQMGGIINH